MEKASGAWIRQYVPQLSSHVIRFKILYWNLIAQKILLSNQSVISGESLLILNFKGSSKAFYF